MFLVLIYFSRHFCAYTCKLPASSSAVKSEGVWRRKFLILIRMRVSLEMQLISNLIQVLGCKSWTECEPELELVSGQRALLILFIYFSALRKQQRDGGVLQPSPYVGYPFFMFPDLGNLCSPYLANGALTAGARTVRRRHRDAESVFSFGFHFSFSFRF